MNEIVIALISFAGTLAGSVFGIAANSRLVSYRLEELSKKVGRLGDVTRRLPVIEEQIKELDRRLNLLSRSC